MLWAFFIGLIVGVLAYRFYARRMVRDLIRRIRGRARTVGPLFPTMHSLVRTMRDEIAHLQYQVMQWDQSVQSFRALVQEMPVAFLVISRDGALLDWNREAQRMLKLPESGPDRMTVYYWMADLDAVLQERLRKCLERSDELPIVWTWRRMEDQNVYEVRARWAPTDPPRLVVLFINRSAEERMSRYKADMIAQLTHDLRTPVTALIQAMDLLEERQIALPAEVRSLMQRQIERLQTFVEKIERLHQSEQQQALPPPQRVNLSELVERITRDLQPLAEQKSVQLHTVIEPMIFVTGWAQWLEGMCLNLIDNAVKFSPQGTTVHIELHRRNGAVELRVRDEGPGIPPDEQTRIFERFYRGRWAVQMGASGSGLGLSIVKHVVLRHGGEIRVHSVPGRGSEFIVHLPQGGVREVTKEKG